MPLIPSRSDIARFASLFERADPGTYVTIRTYGEGNGETLPAVTLRVPQRGRVSELTELAYSHVRYVARLDGPWVVCSPTATFTTPRRAKTEDIANGLALSVDLDKDPIAGYKRLTAALGKPTLKTASGVCVSRRRRQ
jgi:hypothetical protein